MIRTIFIISLFVTGWQANADTKVASHPVNHEFIKVESKKQVKKNICIIKTKETGFMKSIARTYKKAFSRGIQSCFQKQNTFFLKTKKQRPGQDEQIQFTNRCLDNIKCI